jgi:tetratricopeptide (TPR) repeat protein
LCLDVIRRGVERVSFVEGGYVPIEEAHDTDSCSCCELNRDLHFSAGKQGKVPRYKRILGTMWYAYVHEEATDQSARSSSRTDSPMAKKTDTYGSGELTSARSHRRMEVRQSATGSRPVDKPSEEGSQHLSLHANVNLMWTNGLLAAERWFCHNKDSDLRCAQHYAEAGLLKSLLYADPQLRIEATERLSIAAEKASAFVASVEKAGDRVLDLKGTTLSTKETVQLVKASQQLRLGCVLQAELLLFRAGCEIANNAYIKGALDFRKSWKLYQRVRRLTEAQRALEEQRLTPEDLKANISMLFEEDISNMLSFGLGVIYISLAMAPPSVARLANLTSGIESSLSQGQALLYECIQKEGSLRRPLAVLFILFWLLIYIPDFVQGKEDRYREANKLVKTVMKSHRGSVFFYWIYSYLKQKQGDVERALGLLEKATKICSSMGFENPPPKLVFEKGWSFFLCQDWERALESFTLSLNTNQPSQFAVLMIGLCHCMLGNLRKAEKTLKSVASSDLKVSSTERWIKRRAESYLSRRWFQLFPYEIMYVTDSLATMKPDYLDNLLSMLEQIEFDNSGKNSKRDADEFAILQLLKGTALRYCGRLLEAIEAMTEALDLKHLIRNELFAVPHLSYEIGMIYVRGRDWTTANRYLSEAKAFKKKYDFCKGLSFKINSALEFTAKEERSERRR